MDKFIDIEHLNPKHGRSSKFSFVIFLYFASFALAWLATKLTEPVRLALTVSILPSLVRARDRRLSEKESSNDEDEPARKL